MTFPLKLNPRHKVALFITLVLPGFAALSGALIGVLLSSAVAFGQDSAQPALQAQESNAQKLLSDSVEKLDVSGVKTALDKGADPNWVSDTRRQFSVIGTLLAFAVSSNETDIWGNNTQKAAEKKGAEILEMLFKAGAKLQPCHPNQVFCEQDHLSFPIAEGRALLTEVLLKNGLSPTRDIEGELPVEIERITPMEIAVQEGQANIAGGADIAFDVCAPRPSDINHPHATSEAFLWSESSPLPDRQHLSKGPHL